MAKTTVYDKSGAIVRYNIEKLEYNSSFMGESYCTATCTSHKPIQFEIGDYFLFRGEKFTLKNIPTVAKNGYLNSVGDAFKYDNIKFCGYSDELMEVDFLDYVLEDNNVHFTSMPIFSFYCETVNYLAERIQANLNRVFTDSEKWTVVCNTSEVSVTEKNISVSNIKVWEALALVSSKFKTTFVIRGKTITIGGKGNTINQTFKYGVGNGLYGITRNSGQSQEIITRLRTYGDTKNLPVRYYNRLSACGKLIISSINDVSAGKSIITKFPQTTAQKVRLDITDVTAFAMQSTSGTFKIDLGGPVFSVTVSNSANYPTEAQLAEYISEQTFQGWTAVCNGTEYVDFTCNSLSTFGTPSFDSNGTQIFANMQVMETSQGDSKYFTNVVSDSNNVTIWSVTAKSGNYSVAATLQQNRTDSTTFLVVSSAATDYSSFISTLSVGNYIYITAGINTSAISNLSSEYVDYETQSDIPSSLSCQNLMLPGFPLQSLQDYWNGIYANLSDTLKARYSGITFSTDPLQPYINSSRISSLGIKENTKYFDTDDDVYPDIYPSMEGMTATALRSAGYTIDLDSGDNGNLDEVAQVSVNQDGTAITDNGVYDSGESIPNFNLYLKDLGFNFDDVKTGSNFKINMKDGMCGGREFECIDYSKVGNKWVLVCKRTLDSAIGLYFPYKDYNIQAGDKFNITGIYMPKAYVVSASYRLLIYSLEYLLKNDYTKFKYQIYVNGNDIKRFDEKNSLGFYNSIHEGDYITVNDTDLDISEGIRIDTLKINYGDEIIPKYEITLDNNDKEAGTIEKIQNKIDNITNNTIIYNITGSASGGSSVLLQAISVNTNVGYLSSGTVLPAGMSIEAILRKMLNQSSAATLQSYISTGTELEVGTQKGSIAYTTYRNNSGSMEKAYYDGSEANSLSFSAEDSNGKQVATRTLSGYYSDSEVYNATVVFAANGDLAEKTLTDSISVMVRRKWFGGVVSSLDGIDSDKVRALASNGFFTGEGSYKLYIPKGWKYLVLAIPTGYEVEKWYNADMTYADFVQEKEYYGKTTASVYGANGQSAITYNIRTYKAAISGDEINSIFNIVKS